MEQIRSRSTSFGPPPKELIKPFIFHVKEGQHSNSSKGHDISLPISFFSFVRSAINHISWPEFPIKKVKFIHISVEWAKQLENIDESTKDLHTTHNTHTQHTTLENSLQSCMKSCCFLFALLLLIFSSTVDAINTTLLH